MIDVFNTLHCLMAVMRECTMCIVSGTMYQWILLLSHISQYETWDYNLSSQYETRENRECTMYTTSNLNAIWDEMRGCARHAPPLISTSWEEWECVYDVHHLSPQYNMNMRERAQDPAKILLLTSAKSLFWSSHVHYLNESLVQLQCTLSMKRLNGYGYDI